VPEGDTIYRAARALQKALGGRVVTGFETQVAKLASVDDNTPLVGRTVERVEARGKWCLIYFSGDLILVSHMLMSGSWHIYRVGEKWRLPRRMMRVVLRVGGPQGLKPLASFEGVNGGTEVPPLQSERRFPSGMTNEKVMTKEEVEAVFEAVLFNSQIAEFHTARSLERSSQVPKLGPDVLSAEFLLEAGVRALQERARTHPEDEIAVVLLNQRVMAGLGNVYKSEVAFAAGVNPFRQMRTITLREMERMVELSQRYMLANVNDAGARGESGEGIVTYSGPRRTTGAMDRSDRTWVYGRQGQECRRCGGIIEMRKQGGAVRSTYWCPSCQPWVAAEGQSEAAPVGRAVVMRRRKIGC
jgi:endonuclease-8